MLVRGAYRLSLPVSLSYFIDEELMLGSGRMKSTLLDIVLWDRPEKGGGFSHSPTH